MYPLRPPGQLKLMPNPKVRLSIIETLFLCGCPFNSTLTIPNSGLARQIILAFSMKRTTAILFSYDGDNENIIESIYGLRAIASIMLFVTYKFLMIGHQPFTNRAYLTEVSTQYVHPIHDTLTLPERLHIYRFSQRYPASFCVVSSYIRTCCCWSAASWLPDRSPGIWTDSNTLACLVSCSVASSAFYCQRWPLCCSLAGCSSTWAMDRNGVVSSFTIQICAKKMPGRILYSSRIGCPSNSNVRRT